MSNTNKNPFNKGHGTDTVGITVLSSVNKYVIFPCYKEQWPRGEIHYFTCV